MEKITNFYEFIQWCFKDAGSGFVTMIVLIIIFNGTAQIFKGIRGTSECDCDDKDE